MYRCQDIYDRCASLAICRTKLLNALSQYTIPAYDAAYDSSVLFTEMIDECFKG